jgi:ribosomal protein S17E
MFDINKDNENLFDSKESQFQELPKKNKKFVTKIATDLSKETKVSAP